MPSTFHPFPRLPNEIQLKIWRYAALPDGTYLLLSSYVPATVGHALKRGEPEHARYLSFLRWTAQAQCFQKSDGYAIETARARRRLLGVCRMSRQTVLEVWRELVRDAVVPREDDEWYQAAVSGRDDIIEHLDWMISAGQNRTSVWI